MSARAFFALVACVAALTGASASAAEDRVQSGDYIAGSLGDAELNICEDDSPLGMNVDRVCFDVTPGKSYRVEIADLLGHDVGYFWVFRDADGVCVDDGPDPLSSCPNSSLTCGTQVLGAPPGAVELTILLDGPIYGPLDCTLGGPGDSLGMASQGTVTLTRL